MKIAIIHLGRRGAGGPISFELALALERQAQVLAVLSQYAENLPVWRASGLEMITVSTYRNLPEAIWTWFSQRNIRRLADKVRAWKPDVLLFPLFFTWNPFIQRHLREIPSVVVVHDPTPHPGISAYLYRMLEDRSIHRAARCLVLSQVLIPALQERGVPVERIQHIPHGEFRYYQRFATQPNLESGSTSARLLFFGQITAYKGLGLLLDAFERIAPRHQVELQIVGSGDVKPYLSKIHKLPNVELVNRWIPEGEIPGYFQDVPIVVLPYTSASQSGIIALAASFACPVIASRVGGIPEQISHLNTGLLVEPGSVDKLVEAIEYLLDDPNLQRDLGENLRNEYETHRNWDQIATQVYQACIMSLSNK